MPENIKKRADGRYVLRYQDKFFYGRTQKEVLKKRDDYKIMVAKGLRDDSLSFYDYAMRWLPVEKASVSEASYKQYAHILNSFVQYFGDIKLKNITSLHIKDFYNSISNLSTSSIKTYTSTIKSIFASAVNDGMMLRDPCFGVTAPSGTSGTHRSLARWEIKVISSMTDHEMYPFIMTMLFAGLRRGEALALRIDRDVDFKQSTLTVREAVSYNGNQPILGSPKTEAGYRTIPLFAPLRNTLYGKSGLLLYQDGNPLQHATETYMRTRYKRFISDAETQLNGMTKKQYEQSQTDITNLTPALLTQWRSLNIRMHDFRHTFCTMLYNANVDLKTAQKWLGHSDTKMILNIYAHITEEHERQQALSVAQNINDSLTTLM